MIIEQIIESSIFKIKENRTKSTVLSFFRFFSFIAFIVELFRGIFIGNNLELFLGILCFFIFISLVVFSNNISEIINFNERLIKICSDIIEEKPNDYNKEIIISPNHSFSHDLDVFGKKSLFEKINRCQTNFGFNNLQEFLLNPLLESNAIIERQNSIKELSLKTEWCAKFLATAKSKEVSDFNESSIRNWRFEVKLNTKKLNLILKVIPVVNIILILLFLFVPINLFSGLLITIPIVISFIIHRLYGKSVEKIYKFVNVKSNEIKKYSTLFMLIENEFFISNQNKTLQNQLKSTDKITASKSIKMLSTLIDNFENRKIMIVGGILNVVFLWDLQYASKIECFLLEKKNEIPRWFEVVGEFEALISFGFFAYQNEDFIYPNCSDDSNIIEIKNISHPQIPKTKRVYNNFSIVRNDNIAIITGANMTGKSTFLRSIGVNLVLAMNGCPVCATSFNFYPISIFTSMRTNDSLSDESSYFNAEIQRLKLLIEKLEKKEPQFIILDEILKGTNSLDKLKGSELFLEKIMKMKTSMNCLIATHDIDLTKMENNYPNNITNYCFELHNNNDELEPDYKLLKGVTKSMNAIDLMRKNNIID